MTDRNVIVIIVYNRYNNLVRWLDCWAKCDSFGAELVVIHNYDGKTDFRKYESLCSERGVKYIRRKNIGLDIGAFQDIVKERLHGFDNNWSTLLWIADDFIPMKRDFPRYFIEALQERKVAVACTEISRQNVLHIRTSGFCITKEASKKLTFPADPIRTKDQCYQFEYGSHSLLSQIRKMGMTGKQVTEYLSASPLWDTELRANLRRMNEFNKVFGSIEAIPQSPAPSSFPRVTFICPVYNTYPEIISALLNQTYQNWELLLIHDGPNSTKLHDIVKAFNDNRITYIEDAEHKGEWGHRLRKWALEEMREGRLGQDSDYVVITNSDNYLVPTFTEYLLDGFRRNPDSVATYCSHMVHSYLSPQQTTILSHGQRAARNLRWENYKWGVLSCKLELGHIDCSGVMVRKDVACEVGWNDLSHSSDWTYFNEIIKKYGTHRWTKVNGCLLVHN